MDMLYAKKHISSQSPGRGIANGIAQVVSASGSSFRLQNTEGSSKATQKLCHRASSVRNRVNDRELGGGDNDNGRIRDSVGCGGEISANVWRNQGSDCS